jgi:hypothetical protein
MEVWSIMAQLKNTNISDTGSLDLPVGTTAQRPGSPQQGMIRYNSTLGETEYYDGILWRSISDSNPEATGGTIVDTEIGGVPYRIHLFTNTGNSTFTVTKGGQVEYLIIAGGGGGSNRHRGGGGAGGVLMGTTTISPQSYTITVGAGGNGVPQTTLPTTGTGTNGLNSSAFGLTSIGGGVAGSPGGSGGGANVGGGPGGLGTIGQGNNGGTGSTNFINECSYCGGGGGGAGSVGGNAITATPCTSGNGGHGIMSNITGTAIFYAGGGGGGGAVCSVRGGFGGLGGGGNGGRTFNVNIGQSGTPNTGGGGGSGAFTGGTNYASGAGGSGIVIVRYPRNASTTITPNETRSSYLPYFYFGDVQTIIVRDGLQLDLDVANSLSYPGSGTTWTDLSGNGNTGTLVNGVNYNSNNGGSLVFDGVDDFVSLNHVGTTRSFTHEVVLRPTNVSKDQMYIGYGNIGAHYVRIVSSSAFLSVSAGGQRVLSHGQILQNNQFYHIVSIYNGIQLKIYVNNVLTAGPIINQPLTGWGTTRIGRWLDGDQRSFVGDICFLRSYNRELLPSEIQQNFNAIRARYGI